MHKFLQTIALYGLATGAILAPVATQAKTYNLTVDPVVIDTGDFKRSGIGYNGASPGPVLLGPKCASLGSWLCDLVTLQTT